VTRLEPAKLEPLGPFAAAIAAELVNALADITIQTYVLRSYGINRTASH
jgi:hypothetical protein